MIQILKIALILTWIVSQLLGLLAGGWGLLGAQMGQPGSAGLGVLLIFAPTVLAGGGLWLAARRPDLAAVALGVPIVLLVGGFALLLLSIGAARG